MLALVCLCLADAARFGWGGATLDGDRVKWGLLSMGRSPLQPVLVVRDFCRWEDGPIGLCRLEPHSAWAAALFGIASPAMFALAGVFALSILLIALRRPEAGKVLIAAAVADALLGIAAIAASHRISIFVDHGLELGWAGSLTWRASLVLAAVAGLLIAGPRSQGASSRAHDGMGST